MYKNITNQEILGADCLGFFLGIPRTKVSAVGAIDNSNDDFLVPNVPIYPAEGNGILPIASDITAYTRVTTVGPPDTYEDTAVDLATVNPISTAEDVLTGDDIYSKFTLLTAPDDDIVDDVVVTYHEQLEPFIMQDVTPKVDQKNEDISRVNSSDTMTSYGSLSFGVKAEQVMGEDTIQYIKDIMFAPYTGEKTPQEGCSMYDMRKNPQKLLAYENLATENGTIGRIYFENVTVAADLPGGKASKNLSITLDMKMPQKPVMVLLD
jgi:hypothetical protein